MGGGRMPGLCYVLVLLCATVALAHARSLWKPVQTVRSKGSVHRAATRPAQTPPLGYNTWNAFGPDIDEALVTRTADLMVSLGLVAAGYTYLNIDDAWQAEVRGPKGELQPHPKRFPSGIPYLVKYASDRGMQLGLYTDVGVLTCAGYPGSLGHEAADAKTFADWGISYLKVDNCWADPATVVQRYDAMGSALQNVSGGGRAQSMVYSLCSWGVGSPWRGWGRAVGGHTWRIDGDISPSWREILRCADSSIGLARFAGPGGWNDPDMLEVGNGDLTLGMQRAHFALWCVLKSPLLVGANLTRLALPTSRPSLDILLAPELIAVNQDSLGVAGDLIWAEGLLQVWAAPLVGGARAVVLINRQAVPEPRPPALTLMWSMLGWPDTVQVTVRDLYKRVDLAHGVARSFTLPVPSADCWALKLTPDSASATAAPGGSRARAPGRWRDDGWRPWHTHLRGSGGHHVPQQASDS